MDKKIATTLVGVSLLGGAMGATYLGGLNEVEAESLQKLDANTLQITEQVVTTISFDEMQKEMEGLLARKEMNLIKITKIQEDNARIDTEVAKLQNRLNVK